MAERVRGALFNSLGDISGWRVWDAFAGSGALAIEAVSRGADSSLATDNDRGAFKVLLENIENLGLQKSIKAVNASAGAWSSTNENEKFDLILCDPPYNKLQLSTVYSLFEHLKPNGLMVLSQPGREHISVTERVVVVDNRNYGDASLVYYRLK